MWRSRVGSSSRVKLSNAFSLGKPRARHWPERLQVNAGVSARGLEQKGRGRKAWEWTLKSHREWDEAMRQVPPALGREWGPDPPWGLLYLNSSIHSHLF